MKKIITRTECCDEFEKFLGKKVLLLCANYFYAGVLSGVGTKQLLLTEAGIVYETGEFSASSYKDFQKIGTIYVQRGFIEAWCEGK